MNTISDIFKPGSIWTELEFRRLYRYITGKKHIIKLKII